MCMCILSLSLFLSLSLSFFLLFFLSVSLSLSLSLFLFVAFSGVSLVASRLRQGASVGQEPRSARDRKPLDRGGEQVGPGRQAALSAGTPNASTSLFSSPFTSLFSSPFGSRDGSSCFFLFFFSAALRFCGLFGEVFRPSASCVSSGDTCRRSGIHSGRLSFSFASSLTARLCSRRPSRSSCSRVSQSDSRMESRIGC